MTFHGIVLDCLDTILDYLETIARKSEACSPRQARTIP
jgi:hypothetical protein